MFHSDLREKLYTIVLSPVYQITNTLPYPLNYSLINQDHSIIACGVIPPSLTIPIHSYIPNTKKVFVRLSLWGYSYSEPILIANKEGKKTRVTIKKRKILEEDADIGVTLDLYVNHSLLLIKAPYHIINKTPFMFFVMILFFYFFH